MALSRIDTTNMIEDVPQSKLDNNINFRNIIINGDMSIAQRGTSTTGLQNSPEYLIDRWSYRRAGTFTSATFSMAQSTDVPSGQGFAKSTKIDCTATESSLPANVFAGFNQRFEGQNLQYLKKGTSSAESLTASFWVKSNKTGTYILQLRDIDNSRAISKSYTISSADTWEKKTITFAGDTTGAFDNDANNSLEFFFYFSAGSDYTSGTLQTSWGSEVDANRAVGQVNLADSTSNEWYITGVQLEAGQTASEFEFLPHDVNRRRCDRYFQRILSDSAYTAFGSGTVYNASLAPTFVPYRLEMRSSPTFSVSNVLFTQGDASKTVTSVSSTNAGKSSLYIDLNCSSGGMTTGRGGLLLASNNSNAYIQMDAEL